MENFETTEGCVWCNPKDSDQIRNKIEEEMKGIVWTSSKPKICPSIINFGVEMFTIRLVHSGDILDDSLLSYILVKVSKNFENCYVRLQSVDGDLFLIETLSKVADEEDEEEDIASLVSGDTLFAVPEKYIKMNEAPKHIKKMSENVQKVFRQFLDETAKQDIYHHAKVMIPTKLYGILRNNPQVVSEIVQNADYSRKVNFKDFELSQSIVKLRKFHMVVLDTKPIKVPREFTDFCEGMKFRNIRISYLLICAYSKLSQKLAEYNSSFENKEEEKEDDDSWLDTQEKPDGDLEDIGNEMAERFKNFVGEFSQYDRIEKEGPIGFDAEEFQYKLEHFLDSSDEEEEDYEEDILEGLVDDEDDKIIRGISKDDANQLLFAADNWNESQQLEAEMSNGPTMQYLHLFDMKK